VPGESTARGKPGAPGCHQQDPMEHLSSLQGKRNGEGASVSAAFVLPRSYSSWGIFAMRNRYEGLYASRLENSDQEWGLCVFVWQGADSGTGAVRFVCSLKPRCLNQRATLVCSVLDAGAAGGGVSWQTRHLGSINHSWMQTNNKSSARKQIPFFVRLFKNFLSFRHLFWFFFFSYGGLSASSSTYLMSPLCSRSVLLLKLKSSNEQVVRFAHMLW